MALRKNVNTGEFFRATFQFGRQLPQGMLKVSQSELIYYSTLHVFYTCTSTRSVGEEFLPY